MANKLNVEIGATMTGLEKALAQSEKKLKTFSENMEATGRKLKSVGNGLSIGITLPIIALGGASVKTASKLETLETSLSVMTGSAERGKSVLEDLAEFTAKTPFQLQDVGNTAKQLLAFGFSVEEVKNNLMLLGDVSAGSGNDLASLGQIFGQVASAGKLTGERMLQLQERAVPIGPALAKTMGVAETSIKDLVSRGQVSFKQFETAFKSLSDEGGLFAGAMEKQSKTIAGVFSTLRDNVELSMGEIGKSIAEAIDLNDIVKALTEQIQELTEWFKELDDGTKRIILGFTGFLAIVGPLLTAVGFFATNVLPGLSVAFTGLSSVIATTGVAFKSLYAIILSNPWTAIATVIAGVVASYFLLNSETEKTIKKQTVIQQLNEKTSKSLDTQKAKLNSLLLVARDENQAKKTRLKAIKDLNKLSPKYLGDLTLEKINTENTTKSVRLYNEELIKTSKIKASQKILEEIQTKKFEIQKKSAEDLNKQQEKYNDLKSKATTKEELLVVKTMERNGVGKSTNVLLDAQLNKLNQQESQILNIIKANELNNTVLSNAPKGTTTPTGETGGFTDAIERDGFTFETGGFTDALENLQNFEDAKTEIIVNSAQARKEQTEEMEMQQEQNTQERYERLIGMAQVVNAGVSSAFSTLSNSVVNSLGIADGVVGSFVKSIISAGISLISSLIQNAVKSFFINKGMAQANGIVSATQSALAFGPLASAVLPTLIATNKAVISGAFSSTPGFKDGGVIGGNSTIGDKILIRANAGELVLNKKQQQNLMNPKIPNINMPNIGGLSDLQKPERFTSMNEFDLEDNDNLRGQDIRFEVEGTKFVTLLRNTIKRENSLGATNLIFS